MTRDAALDIHGLTAGYGRDDVLHALTVPALAPGHVTALLGPNGSGKSTLLKALAGLVRTRQGSVLLNGQDMTRLGVGERARHMVYLPQSLPAAVHLRVFESVLVAAKATQDALRRLLPWRTSSACWTGWASRTWRCITWTPCLAGKNNWWGWRKR